MIDYPLLSNVKLDLNVKIKPFDCGDTDLNSFLFDDAKKYYEDFMGVTYLVDYEQNLAAYYCLFNDKIVFDFLSTEDENDNTRLMYYDLKQIP
jgi:hypothetical protein